MTVADPIVIVIVNYNSGPDLARCLASIAEHASAARVIVVDNASADGSECAAEMSSERVTLVRSDRNMGFAAAANRAVRMSPAGAGAVMLVNPDCELFSGVVERLAAELEAFPDCAVVGPKILDEDGAVQGSVRGDPTLMTGLFGRSTLLTRLFPSSPWARRNVRSDLTDSASGSSDVVDWVSGACQMIRRTAFDSVKGLDERYFLYWEDADLCRRLRGLGFTTRYQPNGRVMHRGAVSSRSALPLSIRAFHESAYRYYATHIGRTATQRRLVWFVLHCLCAWKLFVQASPADSDAQRALRTAR